MSDLVSVSEYAAAASTSSKMRKDRSWKAKQPLRTRQPNQNSQDNRSVLELLQDVQSELVAHREIMLDIQSRLDQLEDATHNNDTKPPMPHKPTRQNTTRTEIQMTDDLTRETLKRWDAWQLHEQNSDQLSATDLAYPTKRFSGFDFDLLKTVPTSHRGPLDERSNTARPTACTPGNRIIPPRLLRAPASAPITMYHGAASDIKENFVDFDSEPTPPPPILHTPPPSTRSKATAVSQDDGITALPAMPPTPPTPVRENRKNSLKGIRKLFAYRALLKNRVQSEEEAGRRSHSSLRC
jgi:hypothetical protein